MSFGEYGIAMQRKLEIAQWHLSELRELFPADPDGNGLPPIPVQAHFEAGGRSLASIPDQLAAGLVAFQFNLVEEATYQYEPPTEPYR